MEKATALQLRQSLGKLLQRLNETGRPIVIERNRKPAAVIISLEEFRKRFVDRIKRAGLRTPKGLSTLDLLRELRGS